MSEPTTRDREVSELARNSGSRAERDLIVAAYREEIERSAGSRVLARFGARLAGNRHHFASREFVDQCFMQTVLEMP